MEEKDMTFVYKLSRQITAKIYAGMSLVFLIVYVSLASYCRSTGNEQWTTIFLALGFGLFILFFFMAGREMKKGNVDMGP